jgi:agmatinase
MDLHQHPGWTDAGDLVLPAMPQAFEKIEEGVNAHLQSGHRVLTLGGDHSITYPVIRAFAKKYPKLTILHIDAHGDLYDVFEGSKVSHACPFARIMEEKLAARLIQVGIRTYNAHQREQVTRFKVESVEMMHWNDQVRFKVDGPLYISLDMDAMDPAFVPGVSHHEPGGFSPRQVLSIIQNIDADIVGADIVELNPTRDIQNVTAMVAAKCFKEILDKMIRSGA